MNLDEYIWIQLTSSDDALLFTLMTELVSSNERLKHDRIVSEKELLILYILKTQMLKII